MKKNFNKYKIIQILFAIAVILLIANVLVDRFITEIDSEQLTVFNKKINNATIDSLFLASLKNYNIKHNWIHKLSKQKTKNNSTTFIYKVDVPNDLPNILLLNEINKNFSETKLKIYSKELKVGGTSLLEISNGNKLVLTAAFNYSSDISHVAGYLNLLVIMPYDLDFENRNDFLNSSKNITFLFSPSTKNIHLARIVLANKKSYALIIDNNIDELKFEIKNSFNQSRINQGASSIIKSFPNAKFILIAKSFIPNHKIREAFKKLKVKLLYQKNLINFTKEYKGEMKKLFKSYVTRTSANDTLNTILSVDNYLKINLDLKKYSKLGYKFVTY